MSRFLVTGATGFLGRHLVRTLLDHGDQVVALVRKNDAELPAEVKNGMRFIPVHTLDEVLRVALPTAEHASIK